MVEAVAILTAVNHGHGGLGSGADNGSPAPQPSRWSKTGSRLDAPEANNLSGVRKLNAGNFDLDVEDIQELFNYLDVDHNGTLEFEEVANLFKTVLRPPCTDTEVEVLFDLTDKDPDGQVSVEELHRALRGGPFRDHLLQLQREALAKKQLDLNMGKQVNAVSREMLVERLNWRVHRDDSFRTLPLSLVVFLVFILLVITRLQVWNRQQLQRGIEHWIDGYGQNYPGPYHGEHVGDLVQAFEWLISSGLTSMLVYCANDTATGLAHCPFAMRSVLVGDVRLRQMRRGGGERSEWLLHSPLALEHLRRHPGDYHGAAVASANALFKSNWHDGDTNSLDLLLTSWNDRVGMFGLTEVRADFDDWGFVVPHVVSRAVIVFPYAQPWTIILDVVYLLLLAYPTYGELKELLGGMRQGGLRRGCREYWSFWNGVDWVSIVMGWTNIALWLVFVFATNSDAIQGILEERDSRVMIVKEVMSLDTSIIEACEEHLGKISMLFFVLQIIMGINVVSIMLKFFKAFQANPRLQLVTNTLIQAGDELFHFLIVFMAIFLGFSVSGHILFGDDLIEFSSFTASMDTAFRTLLGDFGWYSDQAVSDKGLGSGLPHWMLATWFCMYSSFVTLIILNMLLAIIMDHYTGLVMNVRSASDAPTIWKQTANYIKRARDTKGFIPFMTMLSHLRDKDNPAHARDLVNRESLMDAFEGMKVDQAEFIMKWLTGWATDKMRAESDEENIARLKEVSSLMRAMSDQVHVISLSTSLVTNRLFELQSYLNGRLDGLEATVQDTSSKVRELEALMQGRQDSGSRWARSLPQRPAPLHEQPAEPGGRHLGHGQEGCLGAPGLPPSTPLLGTQPGAWHLEPCERLGVQEPKLVGEQPPARSKREKPELQPCCAPSVSATKSTIAPERRR